MSVQGGRRRAWLAGWDLVSYASIRMKPQERLFVKTSPKHFQCFSCGTEVAELSSAGVCWPRHGN